MNVEYFLNDLDLPLSDSSDDSDMELNFHKQKNENYLEIIVPLYNDQEFFEHFRITRPVIQDIANEYAISEYYKSQDGQFGNISPISQVLIFLWFAGHQTSSFRDVADRFDITISSLHRIIRKLSLYLSNLSPRVIKWPSEEEKVEIAEHFERNGFPQIVGAIDGCHIKIDKPDMDPDSYINRKGFYSIQMQVVCDHKRKIRDLFLGYPGSVHDSRVFKNSPLSTTLDQKCGEYFILGDSGFPLTKKLLTPYKDRGHLTQHELNYNVKLAHNRYLIEHCFGIMKQKFRQLYHLKLRNMAYIVHFIRACCVLHNISINDEFDATPEYDDQPPVVLQEVDNAAKLQRDRIANALLL